MSEPGGLPLALTLGEPAGIGPELTIRVWRRREELRLPPFYLVGDPDFVRDRARRPLSLLSVGLSRTCSRVRRRGSSPIRSQRTCFIDRVSPSRATRSFLPSWQRKQSEKPAVR